MTTSNTHLLKIRTSYNYSIIGIIALSLVCAFSKYSVIIGVFVGTIEIIILLYLFLCKNLYKYLSGYFIVTLTCMDNAIFVFGDEGGLLYSFINMPVIRGYHTLIFACLPLLYVFSDGNFIRYKEKLKNQPALKKSIRSLMIIYIWGVISFLFSFIINDNGFWSNIGFFFWIWRKNFLNVSIILALIIGYSFLFLTEPDTLDKFKNLLFKCLVSLACASLISFAFGWSGDYSEGTTLLLTQAVFYIPFLLLFPCYENKSSFVCFISTAISIFIMLVKASGLAGKWYLALIIIIIVWIAQSISIKSQATAKWIINSLLGILVGSIGIYLFIRVISGDLFGGLAQIKLIQVSMLIKNIGRSDWYDVLPASPKVRIDEFVNIFIEYINKPYYAFLGKGFAGAIEHYTDTTNWNIVGSTFSINEISNGLYAFMHETPFSLFLTAGFYGLYFLVKETFYVVKNWYHNVWCIIGIIWLMLFFNAGAFASLYFGLISWVIGKIYTKSYGIEVIRQTK